MFEPMTQAKVCCDSVFGVICKVRWHYMVRIAMRFAFEEGGCNTCELIFAKKAELGILARVKLQWYSDSVLIRFHIRYGAS